MQNCLLRSASLTFRPVPAPRSSRLVAAMAMKQGSPAICKEMLTSEAAAAYLDVRTPEEFEAGHVKEATNIPFMFKESGDMVKNAGFIASVEEAFSDKDVSLVVGCKSGHRSAWAIEAMQGVGYFNLTNVQGGYDAWVGSGM